MKKLFFFFLLFLPFLHGSVCQEALEKLKNGNLRFQENASIYPDRSQERRQSLSNTQHPFAVIVGCADSRVAPEILFDQGIGDLFVVRVAGNVIGPIELDSVEYAVLHLNTCLIVVLGHANCGAVTAVLDGKTKDIEAIARHIQPAIRSVKGRSPTSLKTAILKNVENSVSQIKESRLLKTLLSKKKIDVVGAYYDFSTGKVDFLP